MIAIEFHLVELSCYKTQARTLGRFRGSQMILTWKQRNFRAGREHTRDTNVVGVKAAPSFSIANILPIHSFRMASETKPVSESNILWVHCLPSRAFIELADLFERP